MDALEVAIITVFIAALCCVIYISASSLLTSYNITVGFSRCVKYVLFHPGSSIVVTVYAPHNIALKWASPRPVIGKTSTEIVPPVERSEICIGGSCILLPHNVQVAIYVSTPSTVSKVPGYILYIPSGVHTIKCMSYWDYVPDIGWILKVIITLYR